MMMLEDMAEANITTKQYDIFRVSYWIYVVDWLPLIRDQVRRHVLER